MSKDEAINIVNNCDYKILDFFLIYIKMDKKIYRLVILKSKKTL